MGVARAFAGTAPRRDAWLPLYPVRQRHARRRRQRQCCLRTARCASAREARCPRRCSAYPGAHCAAQLWLKGGGQGAKMVIGLLLRLSIGASILISHTSLPRTACSEWRQPRRRRLRQSAARGARQAGWRVRRHIRTNQKRRTGEPPLCTPFDSCDVAMRLQLRTCASRCPPRSPSRPRRLRPPTPGTRDPSCHQTC